MKHAQLDFAGEFHVALSAHHSQAASMTLPPDGSVGGPDNRHRGSDQWLFVASGEGSALIGGEVHLLRPGTLVLIERGETHEIRNNGDEPLRALSLYVPPAYDAQGEPLPSGRG